jgi:hypothetical protein
MVRCRPGKSLHWRFGPMAQAHAQGQCAPERCVACDLRGDYDHRPLRANASHDPLDTRNVAKIGVRSGRVAAFFATLTGLALVLAFGICHVLHRTALLSQLMIPKARGRAIRSDARGQPPLGEGASDGGKSKQPVAGSGTKVASKTSRSPLGRSLLSSSPRSNRGEMRGGAQGGCVGTRCETLAVPRRGARIR